MKYFLIALGVAVGAGVYWVNWLHSEKRDRKNNVPDPNDDIEFDV